jgi:hypothetical protein
VEDWKAHAERGRERYADGAARLPDDPDARQRQLTRMGNAAAAAGLASLLGGEREEAARWLARAADRYRDSWADAPPGSWGRPIGAIKARVLAGDWEGAAVDARWALDAGAAEAEGAIGRYAAALADAVLEDWAAVRAHADAVRSRDDFPAAVGDALAFLAAEDVVGYRQAVEAVLESFETRDEYLEDIPVADTVMVLQALAERRGMAVPLASDLLPSA